MNDTPIERPDSVPLDEWARLSREEQSDWWSADRARRFDEVRRHTDPVLGVVELYKQGITTKQEAANAVYGRLTSGNVEEFLAACPEELLEHILRDMDSYPEDDDDGQWARIYPPQFQLSYPEDSTAEQAESAIEDYRQRYRESVKQQRELLRSYFEKRK